MKSAQAQTEQKQVIVTAQPEAEVVTVVKGDYTRYFYRNIEQLNHDVKVLTEQNSYLWEAVEQLQNELNAVHNNLKVV